MLVEVASEVHTWPGVVAIFVSGPLMLFIGILYQEFKRRTDKDAAEKKEARLKKELEEKDARLKKEMEEKDNRLRLDVLEEMFQSHNRLERRVDQQAGLTRTNFDNKIAENTKFTKDGFNEAKTAVTEANRLTEKIATLTEQLANQGKQIASIGEQVLTLQKQVAEIAEQVADRVAEKVLIKH